MKGLSKLTMILFSTLIIILFATAVAARGGGGGGSCFPAGTQVVLPDGSTVNIEDVAVGDQVLSYNEQSQSLMVATVLELESPVREGYYKLNEDLLRVTNEHPIYVKKADGREGWASIDPAFTAIDSSLQVMQLEVSDLIYTLNGYVRLETLEYVEGELRTYNLKTVSDYHTFFADAVLVHNKGGGGSGGNNGGGGNPPPSPPPQHEPDPKVCGDGKVNQAHEECDDGNNVNNDHCTNECKLPKCGDGIRQPGEWCDDGNSKNNDKCNNWCEWTVCGDGIVQYKNGEGITETCDDGNNENGDGCSATCKIEECKTDYDCNDGLFCNGEETCNHYTYQCESGTPPKVDDYISCTIDYCDETKDKVIHEPDNSVCDNGLFCDGVEVCDAYQGCKAGTPVHCDDGQFCNGEEVCDEYQDKCVVGNYPPQCDDGYFCNGQEVCDEYKDKCVPGPKPCDPYKEECNEYIDVCEKIPKCGDYVLDDGEACDDGNLKNGDGCSAYCTIEECTTDYDCQDDLFCNGHEVCNDHYMCEPGQPVYCDDGEFCNGEEVCDEYKDKCVTEHVPQCDDGYFCNGQETCDEYKDKCVDGPVPCDPYDETCDEYKDICEKVPKCGDGVLDYGETCDDGNYDETDKCNNWCEYTFCGDGIVQPWNGNHEEETCDDGNNYAGDGCSPTCQVEECSTDYDCQDGLFCNGHEVCNQYTFTCESGTPVACDNGLFCDGVETCDEYQDKCVTDHVPQCNDGKFCNGEETCDEYTDSCVAGHAVVCDNGLFCDGEETCNEYTDSCEYGEPVVCNDGLFCNGQESCNEDWDICESTGPVHCGVGYECSDDQNACVEIPFTARIFATPTEGTADLEVDMRADLYRGVGPYYVEWDFESDGVIDLTQTLDDHLHKHPFEVVYDELGTYTVFMRVTDQATGNVATDTQLIKVRKIQDRRNIIHINGIAFEHEFYKPGDRVTAFINFENIGDRELRGTRVAAMIPDLGVRSNYVKATAFDVNHESSKALHVTLPDWTPVGDHWVTFVIDIDGDRRIKHRPITVI